MRARILDYLVCPKDHADMRLQADSTIDGRVENGTLRCTKCGAEYAIRKFVPRFVKDDQYVGSFSYEWTSFAQTQLDSLNGTNISLDYFRQSVGREPSTLGGKLVLDAGCGSGRMLELFARTEATVIGIDLSYAVDSAAKNCASYPNTHVVQASIYELPFRRDTFDFAYSIGVLHHTPDPDAAFRAIVDVVKPRGELGVRVLSKRTLKGFNVEFLFLLYFYRRITRRIRHDRLLAFLKRFIPVACFLRRLPIVGQLFKWLLPIADYKGRYNLPDKQLLEWNVLDTFDRLSPWYYYRYSPADLKAMFNRNQCESVVLGEYSVSAYGRKRAIL